MLVRGMEFKAREMWYIFKSVKCDSGGSDMDMEVKNFSRRGVGSP